jgi:putative sigma-54 modulation protein
LQDNDEEAPMRLTLTVRHGHVNDGVRGYVESKFAKLGRRLHESTLVEVVLDRERNPKIAEDHLVEAELHLKGPNLHGREAAATYEAATDLLVDKLERQVERRRDKVVHEPRRRAQAAPPEPVPVEEIEQALRSQEG